MRKLVTVRKIDNVSPIENADMIEQVSIGGWTVVAQKGLHKQDDMVLYFEIDSFLPLSDARYGTFMKFGISTLDGNQGHRVKTKRLRGIYSQGLIMATSDFPELGDDLQEDVDYAELVGVVKYEKQEVTGYNGDTKGSFPWFLRKSDQDRIQNVHSRLQRNNSEDEFIGTLKMDGSSITVFAVENEKYVKDDDEGEEVIGYCSRNLQLKLVEHVFEDNWLSRSGKFYQGAYNSNLFNKVSMLRKITGKSMAIQGELVGKGIQGDFEKFDTYQVFAYNIFDVDNNEFVSYDIFKELAEQIDLQIVPEVYAPQQILKNDVGTIVKMADGKGLHTKYREGIVWKQVNGNVQFKAISNKYLEKEE